MRRSRLISLAAAAAASTVLSSKAHATSYVWTALSGGTQSWSGSVWSPSGTPGSTGSLGAAGDSANLNVGITSNLGINVPTGTYYLSSLTIGSTAGAFTTDIGNSNSSGGVLAFDDGPANSDSNNTAYNTYGDIVSVGAAGSINIISAPIQIDENAYHSDTNTSNTGSTSSVGNYPIAASGSISSQIPSTANPNGGNFFTEGYASLVFDKNSTKSITLSGPISQAATVAEGGIFNAMPSGDTLTISGTTSLTNASFTNGTLSTGQSLSFSGTTGSTTVISGPITDGNTSFHGAVTYGNTMPIKTTAYPNPNPTIILQAASSYTGLTLLGSTNLILENTAPFGAVGTGSNLVPNGGLSGEIRVQNSSNEYGQDISAGVAGLVIQNGIQIAGWTEFTGQNSLTWDGYMYQSTSKEVDNNIVAGQNLTVNGSVFISTTSQRSWTWDGTGLTIVNGNIYNSTSADTAGVISISTDNNGLPGAMVKNGTGILDLNGSGNDYLGATTVNGGLLQFASPGAYGVQNATFTGTASISVNIGGTVALNSNAAATLGSTDSLFIARLEASSTANTGALALTSLDSAQNISFTATSGNGGMGGANTVGMSIGAAGSASVVYTGTITAPATGGYRLGGGNAVLDVTTALTGASNALTVINGGSVQLGAVDTYGGATTIKGVWVVSDANKAAANDNTASGGGYETTTLAVSHIADGSSGLGTSSSTASNLIIDGSTLEYDGSTADVTARLFSINPLGATLNASGSGSVDFSNTGSVTEIDQAPIAVTLGASNGGGVPYNRAVLPASPTPDTSNIAIGMTVTDNTNGGAGLLNSLGTVAVSGVDNADLWLGNSSTVEIAPATPDTLTFTNQNRSLSLTGTGVGVLSPALANSATGKLSVNKTGTGTWTLAGANTYTGGTTVTAGTLVLGPTATANVVALPVNSAVTVGASGTLQLADNASASTPFTSSGADISNELMTMSSLSIASGGVVDIRNNHFYVADPGGTPDDSTFTTLLAAVKNGANSTPGAMIESTEGDSGYGVGIVDGNDGVSGTHVSANQIEVAYTLEGDANLDGKVDITDFNIFAPDFGSPTTLGWEAGDFGYFGNVNITDFNLFAGNFGSSDSGTAVGLPAADITALDAFAAANNLTLPTSSVPEPASLGLVALGAGMLLRRGRRQQ